MGRGEGEGLGIKFRFNDPTSGALAVTYSIIGADINPPECSQERCRKQNKQGNTFFLYMLYLTGPVFYVENGRICKANLGSMQV